MFSSMNRTEWAILAGLFTGTVGLVLRHYYLNQAEGRPMTWGRVLKYGWLFISGFTLGLIMFSLFTRKYDLLGGRDVMNYEWATGPVVIVAFALYRVRCTHKYFYGQLEVVVGVLAIWAGLHISGSTIEQGLVVPPVNDSGMLLTRVVTLLSGVYVIIRGLDNMAQDLPEGRWRFWDRWFPGGRKKKDAVFTMRTE